MHDYSPGFNIASSGYHKPKNITEKKIYRYTAIFEPDKEHGGYTVTIPSLPGCISEDDTFEEAVANIQEAASLYLEVIKE